MMDRKSYLSIDWRKQGKCWKKRKFFFKVAIIREVIIDLIFVKTNVFEREYSKIIMSASEIRNASDYDDYYIASKDEANNQLLNAKKLYDKLCVYLRERLDMNK